MASRNHNFVWSDEETALLMRVVIDYKSDKCNAGFDWETIKNKYEEILQRFCAAYPKNETSMEHYPNCNNLAVFTKEKISQKIKRIKANFRKAVDSGRKSGGGRVVLGLYDECFEIWAGSPAVESMPEGIETVDLDGGNVGISTPNVRSISPTSSSSQCDDSIDLYERSEVDLESEIERNASDKQDLCHKVKDMGEFRRNLIRNLKEKKDSKLTKKRSLDEHMLQLISNSKEEVVLKKRVVDMMEEANRKHENDMQCLKESIGNLTSAINNGFSSLQVFFQQPMLPTDQHGYRNHQNGYSQSFPSYPNF